MRTLIIIALTALPCLAQTTQPATQPTQRTDVIYNGRKVTGSWVMRMHSSFKDQLCMIDGKVYDIGKDKAWIRPFGYRGAEHAGSARLITGGRIVAPKDATTAEVSTTTREGQTIVTVAGIEPSRCKRGSAFTGWIVRGDKDQWYLFEPLTRAEFEAALNDGLKLVNYKLEKPTASEIAKARRTRSKEPVPTVTETLVQ